MKLGQQRAWVGTRTNLFLNLSVEEINQSKCLVKIPHGCQIFPNTARKPEVSKKSKANFSCQGMSSYGWCSMEKLAADLLLGLKFVKVEILSTSFIDFLNDKLGKGQDLKG